MALTEQHRALVAYAMSVVRDKFPDKTEDEYRRAESTLKTSVKRMRRGNKIHYTLSIPELNLMLARTETVEAAKTRHNQWLASKPEVGAFGIPQGAIVVGEEKV